MNLEELVGRYLEHCQRNHLDPKTIRAYRIDLRHFLNHAKADNISELQEVTPEFIRKVVKNWYDQEKESTAYRKSACIRSFLKYLWENDYSENDIFGQSKIKIKAVKYAPPDIISRSDVKALLNGILQVYCDARTQQQIFFALRDMVLLDIMCFTGLHISEIFNLKKNNISFIHEAYVIQVDGYRKRTVCVEDTAAARNIKAYMEHTCFKNEYACTEYLFFTRRGNRISEHVIRTLIDKSKQAAGINKKITPTILRNTLANNMLRKDGDVKRLQAFLGDKDFYTTEKHKKQIETGNIQVVKPGDLYS